MDLASPRQRQLHPPATSGMDKVGLGVMLYAYAVLLGAAYLFGFWRPIGFNIFPYLSLQDYVSAPLNRVVVLVSMPVLFALILFGRRDEIDHQSSRTICLYLVALYAVGSATQMHEAVTRYLQFPFRFDNELTVLALAASLLLASIGAGVHIYRSVSTIYLQALALVLVQASIAIAAGYSDGKAIYAGAVSVFFLDNKDLCEPDGVRDWVYLGKFTDHTFFMNTIDKRLCLTDQKNLKLVSRKLKEGL
jgi:hypothetical protein